jgi:hypothetical protein
MIMNLKTGRLVKLPDGKRGVIDFISGVSPIPTGRDGVPIERLKSIPFGVVVCHELDENGETVMVPNYKTMKFDTKEVLIAVGVLEELSEEEKAEVHASRIRPPAEEA